MLTHCDVLRAVTSFFERLRRLRTDKAVAERELAAQHRALEAGMPEAKKLLNLGKMMTV